MPNDVEVMKAYLILKLDQEDWHGVSDAANDLREMEARDSSTPQSEIERLMGQVNHMAQTVHQAHHQDHGGSWLECPAPLCRDARLALRIKGYRD